MQRSLILLFFLVASSAYSQLTSKIFVDGMIQDQKSFKDTLALTNYVDRLQCQDIRTGYFFTSVDSVTTDSSVVYIYLHKGEKYSSEILIDGSTRKNPSKLITKTADEYSSNGYPFVQVRLDSVSLVENILAGKLEIEEGPEITYDSAFLFSPIKTSKKYLYQLLDIEPGRLFSERNYQMISNKVQRSSFLKMERSTDISFSKNKAVVFLDVLEEQSNTFQGILGIQQGQNSSTEVIGSLDLSIDNLFAAGKELDFFWERYGENSQRLNLFYLHPFFLDSKISPAFSFDLLKQDSIFLTRTTGVGINTFVSPKINLSIQYQKTAGTLLSNDQMEISTKGVADFEKNTYQFELKQGFYQNLNSFKEGVFWRLNIGAGRKQIQKNLNIQDSFYDTILLHTNFFQSEVDFAYQLKVRRRQALYHSLAGRLIQNSELLVNELYRPGGLSSIRGFNEKFFFADRYLSSRLEFRSFFEDRSYLYLFYDQLFYSRNDFEEYPFGIGIGFALATSSGQFTFVLAGGKSKNQDIDFSGIKAHFGYISRF